MIFQAYPKLCDSSYEGVIPNFVQFSKINLKTVIGKKIYKVNLYKLVQSGYTYMTSDSIKLQVYIIQEIEIL